MSAMARTAKKVLNMLVACEAEMLDLHIAGMRLNDLLLDALACEYTGPEERERASVPGGSSLQRL